VVTFFQSLEHLPSPVEALAEASRVLQPGGAVVIETWDIGSVTARIFRSHWQQLNPPSVLHVFSRPGLAALLERAHLSLTGISVTPKRVSLGHVATVAEESLPATGRVLRRMVCAAHLEHVPVPYPLDDLITALAVRQAA
jgi:SAM-dependent methyltransferase